NSTSAENGRLSTAARHGRIPQQSDVENPPRRRPAARMADISRPVLLKFVPRIFPSPCSGDDVVPHAIFPAVFACFSQSDDLMTKRICVLLLLFVLVPTSVLLAEVRSIQATGDHRIGVTATRH